MTLMCIPCDPVLPASGVEVDADAVGWVSVDGVEVCHLGVAEDRDAAQPVGHVQLGAGAVEAHLIHLSGVKGQRSGVRGQGPGVRGQGPGVNICCSPSSKCAPVHCTQSLWAS